MAGRQMQHHFGIAYPDTLRYRDRLWGQQLNFHPHVHCIVSGGGVDDNNNWIKAKRSNNKFLFPVGVLKEVFKGTFLKGLRQLLQKQTLQLHGIDAEKIIKQAGFKKWNVYAKSPFGVSGQRGVLSWPLYPQDSHHEPSHCKHQRAQCTI